MIPKHSVLSLGEQTAAHQDEVRCVFLVLAPPGTARNASGYAFEHGLSKIAVFDGALAKFPVADAKYVPQNALAGRIAGSLAVNHASSTAFGAQSTGKRQRVRSGPLHLGLSSKAVLRDRRFSSLDTKHAKEIVN
jgi:hypothetical protein